MKVRLEVEYNEYGEYEEEVVEWKSKGEIIIGTITYLLNKKFISLEDMELRIEMYCLEIAE